MIAIDININPFASWGVGVIATIVMVSVHSFLLPCCLGGLSAIIVTTMNYLQQSDTTQFICNFPSWHPGLLPLLFMCVVTSTFNIGIFVTEV